MVRVAGVGGVLYIIKHPYKTPGPSLIPLITELHRRAVVRSGCVLVCEGCSSEHPSQHEQPRSLPHAAALANQAAWPHSHAHAALAHAQQLHQKPISLTHCDVGASDATSVIHSQQHRRCCRHRCCRCSKFCHDDASAAAMHHHR